MLIAWMIYAAAIATIIAGWAIALDRLAEIWGFSRRLIWLVALIAAMAVPAGLAFRPARATPSSELTLSSVRIPQHRSTSTPGTRQPTLSVDLVRQSLLTRLTQRFTLPAWNRLAAVAWFAVSLVLGALLCRGIVALWWKRSRWSRSIIDGHSVLVTPDVGPAVVGVIRPRILLPSWVLGLDAHERALMLQHEAEHVRARDPMLIAIAASAVALFPWNPAVWLIVKRLRLAIEIDCDRRVLAKQAADVRDYGMLLLTVGARSGGALQFGVSLAEPRRFLEHRILAMTNARPSRPIIASLPFVAISVLATIAAAQTPRPDSTLVVRQATPRVPLARDAVVGPDVRLVLRSSDDQRVPFPRDKDVDRVPFVAPTHNELRVPIEQSTLRTPPLSIELIRAWIQLHHPNVIAGDSHVNAVTIVVDQNNQYLGSVADSLASVTFEGDTIALRLQGSMQPVSSGRRPLIIVDGVRVDSTAQLDLPRIDNVEVVKGQSAAAVYGAEAEQGVIAIKSMHADAAYLNRLGFAPESIGDMSELRLRPGVVGPNRLYIAVLQLKKF